MCIHRIGKAGVSMSSEVSMVAGTVVVLCGVMCMRWRKRRYVFLHIIARNVVKTQNVLLHFVRSMCWMSYMYNVDEVLSTMSQDVR